VKGRGEGRELDGMDGDRKERERGNWERARRE